MKHTLHNPTHCLQVQVEKKRNITESHPPGCVKKWKMMRERASRLKNLSKLRCCFKKRNNHSNRFVIIRTCAINSPGVTQSPGDKMDEVLELELARTIFQALYFAML